MNIRQCNRRGSHLWFISDDNVILHRVGNVVNAEFKIGTFRDIHETNACPSRGSVLRLCSRDNGHTLQGDGESAIGSNEDLMRIMKKPTGPNLASSAS